MVLFEMLLASAASGMIMNEVAKAHLRRIGKEDVDSLQSIIHVTSIETSE
jgi:hypothetical protein